MVQHDVERQEPPAHHFNGSLPAVADIGKAQLAVDGLAKDTVDSAGVYGLGVGYRPAGNAGFEKCLNETLRSPPGQSQESTGLVASEKSGVEAYQGDPFGLLPGESKRLQPFLPSLQVRILHRFLGWAASTRPAWRKVIRILMGFHRGKKRGFSGALRFTAKEQGDVNRLFQGRSPGLPYRQRSRFSPVPWAR